MPSRLNTCPVRGPPPRPTVFPPPPPPPPAWRRTAVRRLGADRPGIAGSRSCARIALTPSHPRHCGQMAPSPPAPRPRCNLAFHRCGPRATRALPSIQSALTHGGRNRPAPAARPEHGEGGGRAGARIVWRPFHGHKGAAAPPPPRHAPPGSLSSQGGASRRRRRVHPRVNPRLRALSPCVGPGAAASRAPNRLAADAAGASAVPLTAAQALRRCSQHLSEFEYGEVLEYKKVWFTVSGGGRERPRAAAWGARVRLAHTPPQGRGVRKVRGTARATRNHNYDDDRGDYKIVVGDHIACGGRAPARPFRGRRRPLTAPSPAASGTATRCWACWAAARSGRWCAASTTRRTRRSR